MRASGRLAPATVGVLYVLGSGLTLASMDAVGKYLTTQLEVLQVVWARYTFHAMLIFAWLAVQNGNVRFLRSRRPGTQVARSLTMLGATVMVYSALASQPLADVTAVIFFAPVLLTLLAGYFLREAIGRHRLVAVVLGFVGVLLVVRPGLDMDVRMLLPCAAAVLLALYYLLTRTLSSQDSASCTQFYSTALGAVALSLIVPLQWQTPDPITLALMLGTGALGALGHFLLIAGFGRAPASVLSPFLYFQLLVATAYSVLVFEDPLAPTTIAGALLLAGGGLVIWWWEGVLARRRAQARPG